MTQEVVRGKWQNQGMMNSDEVPVPLFEDYNDLTRTSCLDVGTKLSPKPLWVFGHSDIVFKMSLM